MFQQKFYYVHSEYESERQYVDVFLEAIYGRVVKYEVAFELKYVKKGETIDVNKELDKAEVQLMNYMVTKKFNERPSLKAFVVLVHGVELHAREMFLWLHVQRIANPLTFLKHITPLEHTVLKIKSYVF